ncbi:TonB-dependent receptor [Bacteroidales bacterium OttesenSCG-928-B11]|nr:TonB-dependent receptor [Bacteroidales bacterium OttesenSCG-928-E04]MDL2308462.1 TonB-dependent receptor [Bacteroidales bacterium OttesenSCG-928-C03]MDL2311453.1 TonB-dependent receptor [Bacteroidales bacterium OttesenSCG-928-B11]
MKKIISLLSFFPFFLLNAAPVTLSGYVKDNEGNSLSHASIVFENSRLSSNTNENGFFKITLPKPDQYKIRISLFGYENFEEMVNLEKDTAINVVLHSDILNLNQVTVTATRTPKLLKEVPVLTRVITSNDIQKLSAVNVKDLLEMELPGLEFVRQMDGQVVINMQGMGGNYVLFLIDGERMAGETLNNIDYSRLNVQNIERIEIVKGSASTLYGSNAIGGVVNIITKNVNNPWQVNVNGHYGAHNEQNYGLSAGFKQKKWSSLTTATYNQIDAYSLLNTPDSTGKQTESNVYGGRNFSVNEKLTFQPIAKLKFIAKGSFYMRDRSIYFNDKEERMDKKPDRYQCASGGLQALYTISEKHQLLASYSFDQYSKLVNYVLLDSLALTYRNQDHSGRLQYDYFINKRNTLTFGTELLNEKLMSYQFNGSEHHGNTFVIFGQHDWMIFKGFTAVYGARLDVHSLYGAHLSPKVSLMYNLKSFAFRFSYGHGFRSPSLKELYMDWDHQGMFRIMGNQNLVPEKSNHLSFSTEYTHKRINVSGMVFYNNIQDKITEVFNSKEDTALYINVNHAIIYGADLNFTVKLPKGFSIRLSYAYVNDSQMEDGINVSDTRPHSATGRFGYDLNKKNYSLNVTLNGKLNGPLTMATLTDDSDPDNLIFNEVNYPAYMMWRLIINQRFCQAYNLTIGIDNLFNYKPQKYTYNTTLSSGITPFVSVSIDVDKIFQK